jgi:hypothetical protein
MDDDDATTANDDVELNAGNDESWLAEQARLILLEDGG